LGLIFGAVCPARGIGARLVLPYADADAMNLQLATISALVAPGAHAVLELDGAGSNCRKTSAFCTCRHTRRS